MSDTPGQEREPLPVNPERRLGGRGARLREPGRPASRAEPAERTSAGRRIGIRELRQHASVYVDLAEKGYTVDITNRGRLVAQLVPVFEPGSPLERLIASGVIEPAEEPGGVGDIDPYPYPSPAPGRPAASRLLVRDREGRAQAEQAQAVQAQAVQAQGVQAQAVQAQAKQGQAEERG
jgi:antitoxin (DNA-binding transcriptional repressor) of toxin-antitoxin stability system